MKESKEPTESSQLNSQTPNFNGEFNPQEKLAEILKAPSAKRRELLEKFKKDFQIHQEGIAKIQEEMITIALEEEESGKYHTTKELYDIVLNLGKPYGINLTELFLAYQFIENYVRRRNYLKELCSQISDEKELFKKIFGFKPNGKVELIKMPWSLYFRLYDSQDFSLAKKTEEIAENNPLPADQSQPTEAALTLFRSSFPPAARGGIIIENSSILLLKKDGKLVLNQAQAEQIFEHEQIHSLQSLFNLSSETIDIASLSSEILDSINFALSDKEKSTEENLQEVKKAFDKCFKAAREQGEAIVKEEIMAYYLTLAEKKNSLTLIQEKLLEKKEEGGEYDYLFGIKEFFSRWLAIVQKKIEEYANYKTEKSQLNKQELEKQKATLKEFNMRLAQILEESKKQMQQEYEQSVRDAFLALEKLWEAGYSKSQIFNLLIHEPIKRWGKVVQRILEAKNKNE